MIHLLLASVLATATIAPPSAPPQSFRDAPRCLGPDGASTLFTSHLGPVANAVSLSTPAEGVLSTVLSVSAPTNACVRVFALAAQDSKGVEWSAHEVGGNCPNSPLPSTGEFVIPDEVPLAFDPKSESYLIEFDDGPQHRSCLLTWPDLWNAFYGADTVASLGAPQLYGGSTFQSKHVASSLFRRDPHRVLRVCRTSLTEPLAPASPRLFFASGQPPCDREATDVNEDGVFPRDLGGDLSLSASGVTAFALCARTPPAGGSPSGERDRCLWVGEAAADQRTLLDVVATTPVATVTQRWRLGGSGAGAISTRGDLKVVSLTGDGSLALPQESFAFQGGAPLAPIDPARHPDLQTFLDRRETYVYAATLVGDADFTPPGAACAPTRPVRAGPVQVFEPVSGEAPGADLFLCLYRARSDDPRGLVLHSLGSLPESDRLGERGAPDEELLKSLRFEACAIKPGESGDAQYQDCRPAWSVDPDGLFAVSLPQAGSPTLDAVALVARPVAAGPLRFDRTSIELSRRAVRLITTLGSVPATQAELSDPGAPDAPQKLRRLACFDPPDAGRLASGTYVTRSTVVVRGLGGVLAEAAAPTWTFESADARGKRLFCPKLDAAGRQRLFDAARTAILAGHPVELVALQGDREVGRRVTLFGPRLPPVQAVALYTGYGTAPVQRFPVDGSLPPIDTVCLQTDADWGPTIFPESFTVELETDGDVGVAEVVPSPASGQPLTFTRTSHGYCAPARTRALARVPSDAGRIDLDLPAAFSCAAAGGACGEIALARAHAQARGWPPILARSHVGLGLSWTGFADHFPAQDAVPAQQLRAFVALPLALASAGWPGRVAFTTDAGLELAYLTGAATIGDTVATRSAGALGGYWSVCVQTPGVRRWLSFTPELCGSATFDLFQVGGERTKGDPVLHPGAELFAGSALVSLGVTAW